MKVNPKQQRQWLWRLKSFLATLKTQHAELTGYTETVIPDLDLWEKLDAIRPPLMAAAADVERVLEAVEQEIKRGQT